MHNLRQFLQKNGWKPSQVLVVGDCANLNSELALAYQDANLRYLASLGKLEKVHKDLILAPAEQIIRRMPLAAKTTAEEYWGMPCEVPFTHAGRTINHRGLVVLSGPMQQALRQARRQDLKELLIALHQIRRKSAAGQKRYRSEKEINARIATQLKRSSVGNLLKVQLTTTPQGRFSLDWHIDGNALQTAERGDGRFLLVTNDFNLSYPQMLALYRKKDTVEKRFEVCKQDLKMRPLHVHSDERIQAMLLLNMIALLVYSLLERQAEQHGLCLTARQIIEQLSTLHLQQIEAYDGSCAWSWIETSEGQVLLLAAILHTLDENPRSILTTRQLPYYLLLPIPADCPPNPPT
jgi:transposase